MASSTSTAGSRKKSRVNWRNSRKSRWKTQWFVLEFAAGFALLPNRNPLSVVNFYDDFHLKMRIGFGPGTDSLKEMMFRESIFFEAVITLDKSKLDNLVPRGSPANYLPRSVFHEHMSHIRIVFFLFCRTSQGPCFRAATISSRGSVLVFLLRKFNLAHQR